MFKNYRKEIIMNIDKLVEIYRNVKVLPRECHLNWLKDNLNPILKQIDSNLNINWACKTCVQNYMNMIVGWYDRKKAECSVTKKPKSNTTKKKKPTKRKTNAKKQVKK
jgi:hypothetical protein